MLTEENRRFSWVQKCHTVFDYSKRAHFELSSAEWQGHTDANNVEVGSETDQDNREKSSATPERHLYSLGQVAGCLKHLQEFQFENEHPPERMHLNANAL